MRVLYVIDSLAPGGAETSLVEMTPGITAAGVELHVLPLGSRLDLAGALQAAGAQVHNREAAGSRIGNVLAVHKLIRQIRPDLVHTTLFESDIAGRVAARIARVPSSTSLVSDSYGPAHLRESSAVKLRAAWALDRLTSRSAASYHAITAAVADNVSPRLGIDRKRVRVIPRGRDAASFPFRTHESRSDARKALKIAPDRTLLLGVGRLDPQKGFGHLIRATEILQRRHSTITLLIAGKDGRSSSELRSLSLDLGLDVRFLGHRQDVSVLLAAADIFCFPSEREGLGGALIEAMAVGCPILASAIPTSIEVVGGGDEVAVLTEVGNPSRLAEGVEEILADTDAAYARARLARLRFEELYTTQRVTSQMIDFFFNAAARPTHAAERPPQDYEV